MAEGLRERKKRQTRQYISDVATGLFLERGFEAVTVAEVADAANVSVNTVYNYFPAKEDLFLDRSKGVIDRLSRWVRGRPSPCSPPSYPPSAGDRTASPTSCWATRTRPAPTAGPGTAPSPGIPAWTPSRPPTWPPPSRS